jgi:hypothetical protein
MKIYAAVLAGLVLMMASVASAATPAPPAMSSANDAAVKALEEQGRQLDALKDNTNVAEMAPSLFGGIGHSICLAGCNASQAACYAACGGSGDCTSKCQDNGHTCRANCK